MRVYLPARAADLSAPHVSARTGHVVTAALRAANPADSEEDLEVVPFLVAADAALLALGSDDPPLRVVLAADVPGTAPVDGALTAVEVAAVAWSAVASIHVDDPADPQARAVLAAVVAGDADADAAQELDLLWYDVSERALLVTALTSG